MNVPGIRRHPLAAYFSVVFLVSWGAVLAVIVTTTGFPAPVDAFTMTGFAFAATIVGLLLGPPIASLAITAIAAGRPGLRDLGRRIARVRVAARWYALVLVGPATFFAVLAALVPFDRAYVPGLFAMPVPTIAAGIGYALAAGFFEELGWTGFATPRLLERHGPVHAGVLLGLVWTAWHILPVMTFSLESQGLLYLANLAQSVVFLTGFRVLMTLVYARTGSVFVAMVLHASLTASTTLLTPATTPEQMLLWNSLWPLSIATVAAIVAMRLGHGPELGIRRVRHV